MLVPFMILNCGEEVGKEIVKAVCKKIYGSHKNYHLHFLEIDKNGNFDLLIYTKDCTIFLSTYELAKNQKKISSLSDFVSLFLCRCSDLNKLNHYDISTRVSCFFPEKYCNVENLTNGERNKFICEHIAGEINRITQWDDSQSHINKTIINQMMN